MTSPASDMLVVRVPAAQQYAGMPLDRQVRLVAGVMVLLGTMLGMHVHAAFHLLPLLVGLALLWSGVSEWCGLGLLLSRSAHESGPSGNQCLNWKGQP